MDLEYSPQYHWLDEDQTVLMVTYQEKVRIESFRAAMDYLLECFEATDGPVHYISDLRTLKTISGRLLGSAPEMAQHPFFTHPNRGLHVGVTNFALLKRMADIFSSVFWELRLVSTMEDAYDYIEQNTGIDLKPS
ncbi:MAG: hypothetical protein GYB68_13515 [Chloroflexi bacterium]|nr:hypothetical protein [Chloroflexota bacterium]